MKKYIFIICLFLGSIMAEEVIESWYSIYQQQDHKKIGYVHHKITIAKNSIKQNENVFLYRTPENTYLPFLEVTEHMNSDMTLKSLRHVKYRKGKKQVKTRAVANGFVIYSVAAKVTKKIAVPKGKLYGGFGGRNIKKIQQLKVGAHGKVLVAQDEKIVFVSFKVVAKKKVHYYLGSTYCYEVHFTNGSDKDFSGTTYANNDGHDIIYKMKEPFLIWKITTEKNAKKLPIKH